MCYPNPQYPKVNPAFIVVDLNTKKCIRIAQKHPSVNSDIEQGGGINPVDIDENYE